MKIIVSGASGFVGRNLVEYLHRQGHEIVALVRSRSSGEWFREKGIPFVICDLGDYSRMDDTDGSMDADIFYHFAWEGTSGAKRADLEIQTKNVIATRDAVALAKRCGCRRFVFAGSIMEYEAIEYVGMDHSTPPPSYIYSCQKLAADQIAKIESQKAGLEYISLIISNIYGPSEHSPRFMNTLIRKMQSGEKIALTEGTQQYDFIYMSDAVRAICLAGIKGKANCSYYIGNPAQMSLREYVEAALKCIGSHSALDFGAVPYYGVSSAYQRIDTGKLKREFQFDANVSFQQGIKEIITFEEDLL